MHLTVIFHQNHIITGSYKEFLVLSFMKILFKDFMGIQTCLPIFYGHDCLFSTARTLNKKNTLFWSVTNLRFTEYIKYSASSVYKCHVWYIMRWSNRSHFLSIFFSWLKISGISWKRLRTNSQENLGRII